MVRFTPDEFDCLAQQLRPYIEANRDLHFEGKETQRKRRCKLDVPNRLFLVLRKLAGNAQFKDLEMATGWPDSALDMDFWCGQHAAPKAAVPDLLAGSALHARPCYLRLGFFAAAAGTLWLPCMSICTQPRFIGLWLRSVQRCMAGVSFASQQHCCYAGCLRLALTRWLLPLLCLACYGCTPMPPSVPCLACPASTHVSLNAASGRLACLDYLSHLPFSAISAGFHAAFLAFLLPWGR